MFSYLPYSSPPRVALAVDIAAPAMPSVLVSVRCFAPAAAVAAVVAATAGGSKPAVAIPYLPFLSPSRVAVALFAVVSSPLPVLVSVPCATATAAAAAAAAVAAATAGGSKLAAVVAVAG